MYAESDAVNGEDFLNDVQWAQANKCMLRLHSFRHKVNCLNDSVWKQYYFSLKPLVHEMEKVGQIHLKKKKKLQYSTLFHP